MKKEAVVDHEQPITHHTGKKLDRIILVVLALALGYFAFDKFVLDPASDQSKIEIARQEGRTNALIESRGDKSIAVLPFDNRSNRGEDQFFTDGIHDDLLTTVLSRNLPVQTRVRPRMAGSFITLRTLRLTDTSAVSIFGFIPKLAVFCCSHYGDLRPMNGGFVSQNGYRTETILIVAYNGNRP